MSLSKTCKQAGFKDVTEVERLSGETRSSLQNMLKNHPHRLRGVLYLCAVTKINNAMGDL